MKKTKKKQKKNNKTVVYFDFKNGKAQEVKRVKPKETKD